jgi:hypothetical protein
MTVEAYNAILNIFLWIKILNFVYFKSENNSLNKDQIVQASVLAFK